MIDTLPKVLSIVPGDSDGCLLWRNWWPSEEITKHGLVADWMYVKNYLTEVEPALLSGKYNLVVTPRFVWQEPWMVDRFMYTLRKSGVVWAYEIDDDMFSPDIVERQVKFAMFGVHKDEAGIEERKIHAWAQMEYERVERIALMEKVNGITVSTNVLADQVRQYTQNSIYVIPNAMNIPWFIERMNLKERIVPPISIGYSGGWRPFDDVRTMAKAWERIAKRFPEVQFVLHGQPYSEIIQTIPANQLHVLPWSNIQEYPSAIKNIDIACCSVFANAWNLNKSCIKWYEMTVAGAACVASHALYDQEITHMYNGLLATTVDEWETQLLRLIVDKKLRNRIQANAFRTISAKHNIELSWMQWLTSWTDILSKAR